MSDYSIDFIRAVVIGFILGLVALYFLLKWLRQ